MFNHFKPTPRKPQGGISRGLTASENHRILVRLGYIAARQPQPEPTPVEPPEPFCDEGTDALAVEDAKLLETATALKEPNHAKGAKKASGMDTLCPSPEPKNPVDEAGFFKVAVKRTVPAAGNPNRINYRRVTLPDIQDSS